MFPRLAAAVSLVLAGASRCDAFVAPAPTRAALAVRSEHAALAKSQAASAQLSLPLVRPTLQRVALRMAVEAKAMATAKPGTTVGTKDTVIVTGASSGIGLAATKNLIDKGWHVVMAVRSYSKAEKAAKDAALPEGSYSIEICDLASMESVRKFISDFKASGRPLNALVCNAAVWYPKDKEPRFTADGFEEAVAANHLGHFLLCNSLVGDLKTPKGASQSRVVFIGTQTHNPNSIAGKVPPRADLGDMAGLASGFAQGGMIDGKKYEPTKAYKDSKVCNVLTMRELAKRGLGGKDVVYTALFPGCIAESPLFREKRGWFRKIFPAFQKYVTRQYVSVDEAGRRVAAVVTEPTFSQSGAYWKFLGQGPEATPVVTDVSDEANDDANGQKLWDISSKLVGLA